MHKAACAVPSCSGPHGWGTGLHNEPAAATGHRETPSHTCGSLVFTTVCRRQRYLPSMLRVGVAPMPPGRPTCPGSPPAAAAARPSPAPPPAPYGAPWRTQGRTAVRQPTRPAGRRRRAVGRTAAAGRAHRRRCSTGAVGVGAGGARWGLDGVTIRVRRAVLSEPQATTRPGPIPCPYQPPPPPPHLVVQLGPQAPPACVPRQQVVARGRAQQRSQLAAGEVTSGEENEGQEGGVKGGGVAACACAPSHLEVSHTAPPRKA